MQSPYVVQGNKNVESTVELELPFRIKNEQLTLIDRKNGFQKCKTSFVRKVYFSAVIMYWS